MTFELIGRDTGESTPAVCPECGEPTTNVQGLVDCPACRWSADGS